MNSRLIYQRSASAVGIIIFLAGICLSGSCSFGAESCSWTNWNGLALQLSFQKTNFLAGEDIEVCIAVSNITANPRVFVSSSGDRCGGGIGEFIIVKQPSETRLNCVIPKDERGAMSSVKTDTIAAHEGEGFGTNLRKGYALTNIGTYSVRAAFNFAVLDEPLTNCVVETPPITITISTPITSTSQTSLLAPPIDVLKVGTNAPLTVPKI